MHRCKLCNSLFNRRQDLENHYCEATIKEENLNPIGLRPRIFWLHSRRQEILEAIDRYLEKGVEVPIEWVQEYNDLTKEVSK